jgi:hypothetical protein
LLEEVFLKGGFSGFGGGDALLTLIAEILPIALVGMVLLIVAHTMSSALGGTSLNLRFWKKKKRSYSSSKSS